MFKDYAQSFSENGYTIYDLGIDLKIYILTFHSVQAITFVMPIEMWYLILIECKWSYVMTRFNLKGNKVVTRAYTAIKFWKHFHIEHKRNLSIIDKSKRINKFENCDKT